MTTQSGRGQRSVWIEAEDGTLVRLDSVSYITLAPDGDNWSVVACGPGPEFEYWLTLKAGLSKDEATEVMRVIRAIVLRNKIAWSFRRTCNIGPNVPYPESCGSCRAEGLPCELELRRMFGLE